MEKIYDLAFTGNMSYPPNVKAAHFLATEIIPLLIQHKPNIKLVIAGADPHSSVKRLASKNVIVTGWLDQITDAYNQSKIFIAPMQIGTGMQNKILEAMAMQIPCITSPLAGDAIGATHDANILIAENASEFANLCLDLLQSEKKYSMLKTNAFNWVKSQYDWNINGAPLLEMVSS